jgi:hypothetical protein
MIDDTPRRKLIKINQENENDPSQEGIPLTFNDDDLARKVEECFRNTEQTVDVEMMETEEINNKTKSSTRRRSRFRFSFSNSNEDEEQRNSRLSRTHSASTINPENDHHQIYSSRRRKSYSTTGLANELKNLPNEPITNLDKVFHPHTNSIDFICFVFLENKQNQIFISYSC